MMNCSTKRKLLFCMSFPLWLLVGACVLELGARIVSVRGKSIASEYAFDWEVRKVTEAFHPALFADPWKVYKPGVRITSDETGASVSINSDGFRGPELRRTPDVTHVIACLGGSTTVNGKTDETTYPAFLERALNRDARLHVRVVNSGIGGMNAADYRYPLATLVDRIRPDIVIEYNAVNDICWGMLPSWRRQLAPSRALLLRSHFVRYAWGDSFLPPESVIRKDIREFIIDELRATAAVLEEHRIRFYVCSFLYPDPDQATRAQYRYLDQNFRILWQSRHLSYRSYCRIVDLYNEELKMAFEGTPVTVIPLAESVKLPPDAFDDICHLKWGAIEQKAELIASLIHADLVDGGKGKR